MKLKIKSTQATKTFFLLAASLLLFANMPNAQAAQQYNVSARFSDGGIQGETLFNGSFNWDGSTLSNFTGGLTQSMWACQASTSTYLNRMTAGCGPMGNGNPCTLWDTDPATPDGNAPVLNLSYQLGGITAPDANGDVLATVFLKNIQTFLMVVATIRVTSTNTAVPMYLLRTATRPTRTPTSRWRSKRQTH